MISYELEKDSNGKEIAKVFFDKYITKSVEAIEEKKYETAINIYTAMTDSLASNYNINLSLINIDTTNVDYNTLGHARKKALIK